MFNSSFFSSFFFHACVSFLNVCSWCCFFFIYVVLSFVVFVCVALFNLKKISYWTKTTQKTNVTKKTVEKTQLFVHNVVLPFHFCFLVFFYFVLINTCTRHASFFSLYGTYMCVVKRKKIVICEIWVRARTYINIITLGVWSQCAQRIFLLNQFIIYHCLKT